MRDIPAAAAVVVPVAAEVEAVLAGTVVAKAPAADEDVPTAGGGVAEAAVVKTVAVVEADIAKAPAA